MKFLHENSLFSTIISLYILLLLYFPFLSLKFIFSPIIFSTVILLLYILRLGASQKCTIERIESDSVPSLPQQIEEKCTIGRTESGSDSPDFASIQSVPQQIEEFLDVDRSSELGKPSSEPDLKRKSRPIYADSFLEWDVRAPLEVIYEEYEGEDAGENDSRESQMNIIQRYASLSLFYPESDSDASSEGDYPASGGWDSPEDMCDFRWEGDDREGLIEIALDEKRNCVVDEDNLIEIDLSPER